jgi:hypothetical protein
MSAPVPTKLLEPRRGGRVTDRRAWGCLERCRRKLALDDLPLPIPVEDWIESPLGIRFGFGDLSHLGDKVLGAAFVHDREIVIDESVLHHDGRCRFTCAHELGHVVLHRTVQDKFYESALDVTFSADRYERQADRFAAAFLMPLPQLERAKRFAVSLSAAIYRCVDVQPLIRKTQQLLPRDLIPHLMQRAGEGDEVMFVQIRNGIPEYRDLFTEAQEGEAGVG